MQMIDGKMVYSASDLTSFLACRHKVGLDEASALHVGDRKQPSERKAQRSEEVDIVARHGLAHEKRFLEKLRDEGFDIVEIPEIADRTLDAIVAAADATLAEMRAGREVIFQAVLFDGQWLGYADFLIKVDEPSDLGNHSYEAHDTKLARSTKVSALIQLAEYSAQLERIQGAPPLMMHVVLGDGFTDSLPVKMASAYHRRLRHRFVESLSSGLHHVYPVPVAHCQVCDYADACAQRRIADDHLSLLPGARRDQVSKLEAAEIKTVVALSKADPPVEVPRLAAETAAQLHSLARLQVEARAIGLPQFDVKPTADEATRTGFNLLPEPDLGDLFFDLEGDPFLGDDGREYLWGWCDVNGEQGYVSVWGHEPDAEVVAVEHFIDLVTSRLIDYPDMHVYHYASYELTALKRLVSLNGTRESELDALLRSEVFVDLYKVTRQALFVSVPSYSIKDLEAFYRQERDTGVKSGMESVVAYEEWLETGDQTLLDAIEAYNRDDCVSTLQLRDWLLQIRPSPTSDEPFEADHEVDDEADGGVDEASTPVETLEQRRHALVERLLEDVT